MSCHNFPSRRNYRPVPSGLAEVEFWNLLTFFPQLSFFCTNFCSKKPFSHKTLKPQIHCIIYIWCIHALHMKIWFKFFLLPQIPTSLWRQPPLMTVPCLLCLAESELVHMESLPLSYSRRKLNTEARGQRSLSAAPAHQLYGTLYINGANLAVFNTEWHNLKAKTKKHLFRWSPEHVPELLDSEPFSVR